MKYILIIGDGMADNPVPQLQNQTPLQHAAIPVMDALAAKGEVGSVVNCPAGLPAGSDTAILSIFGADPNLCYTGRSPPGGRRHRHPAPARGRVLPVQHGGPGGRRSAL